MKRGVNVKARAENALEARLCAKEDNDEIYIERLTPAPRTAPAAPPITVPSTVPVRNDSRGGWVG